jgi:tetratricopeptide (TPR) repeat protein
LISDEKYAAVIDLTDSLQSTRLLDPRLKGQRALALGMVGRREEAVTLFEESLLADYAVCENHLNFAVLLLEMGKTGRALTELAEARRFCGERNIPVISRNAAVAHIKEGSEEKALLEVEEGLEAAPDDPYLLGMKGMLVAEANPAEAESLLVRAEEKGAESPDFLYQLGLLMLKTGRPERSLGPLEAAVRLMPEDPEVSFNYAEALARAGRKEEAERVLMTIQRDDPGHRATRRLARLLYSQKEYDDALALFRSLEPTPENLDRVAMCLHNLGRTEEAIEIQRRVVTERPDWTTGMINLAVMLGAEGEIDEAEALLVRVLEFDPENLTARINLESLRGAR